LSGLGVPVRLLRKTTEDQCNGQKGKEAKIFQRRVEKSWPGHEDVKPERLRAEGPRRKSKAKSRQLRLDFRKPERKGQGPEEAIKEIINARQSVDNSTAGPEAIQSSSSSSELHSSSLRCFWVLTLRVRNNLNLFARADCCFIWLTSSSGENDFNSSF
jgi:hypothetical protein